MKTTIFLAVTAIAVILLAGNPSGSVSNILASDSAKTCPVSGESITGEGVKYSYLNNEVVFCCEGCVKSFKKNPAKFMKGASIKDVVCDMEDSNSEINAMHEGVKYYFCNESCKAKFEKDPDAYLSGYKSNDDSKKEESKMDSE